MGQRTKSFTNYSNFSRSWSGYSCFFTTRQERKDRQREKIESQPKLIMEYEPNAYPDIYCPAKSYSVGIGNWLNRKFLRIAIRNEGRGVANQCTARLRIIMDKNDNFSPSLEPKTLLWESMSTVEDIGVRNHAILDVIFSDSMEGREKKAFVSTPFNLEEKNLINPLTKDGFHIGNYTFELEVRTIDGFSVKNNFKIHVTDKWDEISMEEIDSP